MAFADDVYRLDPVPEAPAETAVASASAAKPQ